jgi:hypothetical protein
MSQTVDEAVAKLRRLAKAEGLREIVCIEKRQLRRLKQLALAYLQMVADDGRLKADTRAAAKKEYGNLKRF